MAGNKHRAARPEEITGTAAARVPVRYDTAQERNVRSGQRPGGGGKRKTGTGKRSSVRTERHSEYQQPVRGQKRGTARKRGGQGAPQNSRISQEQRMQRESRPDQNRRMHQNGRTARAQTVHGTQEHANQQQAYETGAVPKKKRERRFYDLSLVVIIIVLTVFGLVMIYSASSYTAQLNEDLNYNSAYFMQRQGAIALGGFIFMLIISKMDYHWLYRLAVPSYALSHILMIIVTLVGREVNGKKRWLDIGPIGFQPSEFAKIALIIMLAAVITKLGGKINRWAVMGKVFLLAVAIGAIVAVNNLSTGIILVGIGFVMLFVACEVKWPFFLAGGGALGILMTAGPLGKFLLNIHILKPYQYNRIVAWLNPELDPEGKSFQTLQGLYAIGSGGLMGQGLGESIQKLGFLPESQNDMIFAIICEELGLFGAIAVIMLFLLMIYRFVMIANDAPDLFGALLVVGVMAHIAIQVILNIAVVTNTIPNTGITLPFISYGGTSVLFLMVEMGIVLSVSNQIRAAV